MLARKTLLAFVANLVGAASGLVGLFFIGRYMTPTAYGMFGVAFAIAGLARFTAKLGFDKAHVKRVSEGRNLPDCITTFSVIKLLLTTLFVIVIVAAALIWDTWRGFHDSTTLPIILVTTGYYVLLELRQIPFHTFVALRKSALTQATVLVENLVRVPLLVIVALVFGASRGDWVPFRGLPQRILASVGVDGAISETTGALLISVAYAVSAAAALAFAFSLLARQSYGWGRFDLPLARDYRRFALPVAVMAFMASITTELDRVMLGFFWSATDVGYYFASQRLAAIVLIVPAAVSTLFFPLISELRAGGRSEGVNEVARTAQRLMSLAVMFASMLLIVFAEQGLHIFLSDAYLPASPVVAILGLHVLVQALTAVAVAIVMAFDRPRSLAMLSIGIMSLNLVLNLIFIPSSILGVPLLGLRASGAASATLLADVVSMGILLVMAQRLTGAWHVPRAVFLHAAAAVLTGIIVSLTAVQGLFGGLDRFYELGAIAVFAAALYLGTLIAAREVTVKDWIFVQDVIHPGRMASYVRDEFRRR